MIEVKFVIAAVALEVSSIATAIMQGNSDWVLLIFLLQHAAASGLLALFIWNWIPEKFRYPRLPCFALVFNFSFFIPLLGQVGMLTAVLLAMYRRRVHIHQPCAKRDLIPP